MKPVDGLDSTAPQATAATEDLTAESASDAAAIRLAPGDAPGYRLGELIGRGGMGEVVVARDRRIGRDVALKRMRSRATSDGALDRFLREAKIQARLDHPAIVPVYELGEDSWRPSRCAARTAHRRPTSTRSVRSCSRSSPASRCIRAVPARSRARSNPPRTRRRSAARTAAWRPSSTSYAAPRSPMHRRTARPPATSRTACRPTSTVIAMSRAAHARAYLAAQNKLVAQRWHLEQLLPQTSTIT